MIPGRVCGCRAWRWAELAAACAIAIAAWPAAEVRAEPTLELGVFGGTFMPNDRHEFYDPRDSVQVPLEAVGPDFGVRVAFLPLRFLGIEAEGDLLPQSTEAGDGVLLYGARGHLVLQIPTRVAPFIIAGAGTIGVRSSAAELSDDNDLVGHVGAGAKIRLSRRFALRVEGRGYRAPRAGGDAGTNHFAALLGVSFTLGGAARERPVFLDLDMDGIADAADSCPRRAGVPPDGCPPAPVDRDGDRDGLADEHDRCPREPETVNAFEEEDGCPDQVPDSDGDRVVDPRDACPQEPEDVDGFEDDNGCPDRDNDGDQVGDADDRCPGEAGPSDNQGCPDMDRDRDGVADRVDNCPAEAGQAAEQGCRDKQLVVITQDRLRLLQPITFTTNRTAIRRRSLRVLDNLIAVLAAHPELANIRIAGHTDDRGGDEHNKALSQRRAEQIRRYMIGRGVAADRLEAIGHGEEHPVEPNEHASGRAMNRRVELEIVRTAGQEGGGGGGKP